MIYTFHNGMTGKRRDELNQYCKLEGMDSLYLLSRLPGYNKLTIRFNLLTVVKKFIHALLLKWEGKQFGTE